MLFLFIPIGITVNLAEKIDKILENQVPFMEVVYYYFDFIIYFANLLFPIFLFLSVIWFTSKLAMNTEIIAYLSSGVSFYRFLRPYLIGATIVCLGALASSMYLAPQANKGYNEFIYQYLKKGRRPRKPAMFTGRSMIRNSFTRVIFSLNHNRPGISHWSILKITN